jgi:DNA adenine methylase
MKNARCNSNIAEISVALYPGRKHWFVQQAADYFRNHPCHTLLEPFSGSGIVGLSLLYADIVQRLILIEKDVAVACLLKGMITDPTLSDRFRAFHCTRENVEQVLATETGAFAYLVRSRVSNRAKWWGGRRTEISCRWCPDVVIPNLRRVYAFRNRITVICGDAFNVMPTYHGDSGVGCFCDPPYTAGSGSKGKTIYRHHEVNHPKLFSLLGGWRGPWILTEDNSITVRRLALCNRLNMKAICMNTSENIIKRELMMTRRRPLF